MQEFVAFNIDGTQYKGGLAHVFLGELIKAGVINTELEEVADYQVDSSDSRLAAALRAGQTDLSMPFKEYVAVGRAVAERAIDTEAPGFADLIDYSSRMTGQTTIAVSNLPYVVAKPFCDLAGPYDHVIASMPENRNGYVGPKSLVSSTERTKGEWLRMIVDVYGLTFTGSVAIGASMSDASMLELVERPIVVARNSDLVDLAQERNWEIWS